jgi:hypothetical protein
MAFRLLWMYRLQGRSVDKEKTSMAHFFNRCTGRAVRLLGFVIPIFIVMVMVAPNSANAQGSITITVDENGHGVLVNSVTGTFALPFSLQADAGPGGLAGALTYNLLSPPGLVTGDLVLQEFAGGPLSDLIRFNSNCGCLVFYSDVEDGSDALADIGFPTGRYTNVVSFVESGPEGDNGFSYTPIAGQPGFVAGAAFPVTYVIKSDTSVPEPASLVLLSSGLFGIGYIGHRRRRKSS